MSWRTYSLSSGSPATAAEIFSSKSAASARSGSSIELELEQLGELVQQRQRPARIRGGADVVRKAGPQAHDLDPVAAQTLGDRADDAGGSLVRRRGHADPLEHARVAREAGDGDRSRVDDVGQEGADQYDAAHAEPRGELGNQVAEAPPTQMRLAAAARHELARPVHRAVSERHVRPIDHALMSGVESHHRTRHGEIVEILAIDLGERNGADRIFDVANGERRGVSGVVPAAEGQQQRRIAQRGSNVQPKLAHRGQSRTPAGAKQA